MNDSSPYADPEDCELVTKAKKETVTGPEEFTWDHRDLILYHLGIGAGEKDLHWTYEGHDNFSVIPTFGVIPSFDVCAGLPLDWLPNYNPVSFSHLLNRASAYLEHLYRLNSCTESST